MQKEKEFNFGVSTLPKKINQRLVDESKARFLVKKKGLSVNNIWFIPIIGA